MYTIVVVVVQCSRKDLCMGHIQYIVSSKRRQIFSYVGIIIEEGLDMISASSQIYSVSKCLL